jgi:hypothetical protein
MIDGPGERNQHRTSVDMNQKGADLWKLYWGTFIRLLLSAP